MTEEMKITLPKLGESIHSATIVQWFKKEGDEVALDEPLLEVSTDKVNSEIPSPKAGVIKEILAQPDQELQIGEPLAVIVEKGAKLAPSAPVVEEKKPETQPAKAGEMKGYFSPALLRVAQEKGVSMDELQTISGTGAEGRLTRKDLDAYIEKKGAPQESLLAPSDEVEHVKMSGMRKAIADNMVRSFYQAPHASLVTEIDVTPVLELIKQEKQSFLSKHGCKLTITSFVVRSLVNALKDYPLLNSSLHDDTIVVKHFVNVGIAVSLEQGLMVPVMKGCHRKTLVEIAKSIADVSARAREGKLQPDEVKEGTITLSNFGMAGVSIGVPIIRFPEVAIIGMAAIQKKLAVMPDETTAVRSLVNMSLTFDHRVLDGMYGCQFMQALKKHLEEDLSLEI